MLCTVLWSPRPLPRLSPRLCEKLSPRPLPRLAPWLCERLSCRRQRCTWLYDNQSHKPGSFLHNVVHLIPIRTISNIGSYVNIPSRYSHTCLAWSLEMKQSVKDMQAVWKESYKMNSYIYTNDYPLRTRHMKYHNQNPKL